MTEKLKVNHDIANALNHMPIELSTSEILRIHADNLYYWYDELKPLMDLKLEELATALIVGYEVELTPHELIQKEYKKSNVKRGVSVGLNDMILAGAENGFMNGIEFTLNTLGITVKGVNDDDNNS